jgi:hypothetical protein
VVELIAALLSIVIGLFGPAVLARMPGPCRGKRRAGEKRPAVDPPILLCGRG